MKVAYLTAGAGSMYCGSCMRDNTLAAALIRQKRDVVLIPMYSPIKTDEPSVSTERVFYGGINVFLQQKSSLFRLGSRLLDRVLDAPAVLRLAMRRAGATTPEGLGPLTISMLRGEDGAQRRELDKLIEGLAAYRPDVVHLPDALFVGLARPLHDALGAAIVCTLTGEDIFLDALPAGHRAEAHDLIRQAAPDVHGFIAVSRHYANYARENFGVPSDRLHHVPMGIRIEPHDRGAESAATRPFTIGYLARICPEKGLHVLCDAFIELHRRGRPCRLRAAGYTPETSKSYVAEIVQKLEKAGLRDSVDLLGEVDRRGKLDLLRSCDVFSVPTVYREAKGIYVLEAMSQGLPVVQPAHGSFPELIEATGGGLLFSPNDVAALADRMNELMDQPQLRDELGSRGRRAVAELYHEDRMAEGAWDVFSKAVELRRALVEPRQSA